MLTALIGIVWVCSEEEDRQPPETFSAETSTIVPAAERTELYFDQLQNKSIGLAGNHSSRIGETHLVDTLLKADLYLTRIFSPEHGFRGEAAAGEKIKNGRDPKSGLPVISLYGNNKKLSPAQLGDIDLLIFDIQDVGARFYTYLSTLHFVMQACAETSTPLLVLDRPNPNGHYIDGPVLDTAYSSFVGMHPVPVVYGMTIGEYARMINGEGWLENGEKCSLEVIRCKNYHHDKRYEIPLPPSPNLPDEQSVLLYPSLCFFEGTVVSIGRGTDQPFTCYGHPALNGPFQFTPESSPAAGDPKLKGRICRGYDLSGIPIASLRARQNLNLSYLITAYQSLEDTTDYFSRAGFFDTLAGTDRLRKQIIAGRSEEEIRATWKDDLEDFRKIRKKYLLYD